MSTIFSKIISGEIPCHKIAENEKFLAFLDVSPLKMGHTLVIPKLEKDYIFDIETATYSALFLFAQDVARAVKLAFPCKKIGLAVIGLEVPHAHIHLVPINEVSDMNFSGIKLSPTAEELAAAAIKIKGFISLV